jgi:hypothetical protein
MTTTSPLTTTVKGESVSKSQTGPTEEITPSTECNLGIDSLGEMVATGTMLMLLQDDGERRSLVVLSDAESGLASAVERLTLGNLEGCLFRESETPSSLLALCSTGEVGTGDGEGGWQEPEPELPEPEQPPADTEEPPEPTVEPKGNVMVVALDHGEGRYDSMTSIDDYEIILAGQYSVDTWRTSLEGLPTWEQLVEYDLVVMTAGDYQDSLGDDESDLVFDLMIEAVPVIISGAFVGDTEIEAVQRDIQVFDADHPLTVGFDADEVIEFVAAPSNEEYETSRLDDIDEGEGTVVPFVRGPESEEAGAPSVFILEDEVGEVRIAFVGFPIYLLPEKPKERLVLNTVDWMLESE